MPILFQGEISLTKDGLLFGASQDKFPAQVIPIKNHNVCTLNLVSPFQNWGKAMDELEIINVTTPILITVTNSVDRISPILNPPEYTAIQFK